MELDTLTDHDFSDLIMTTGMVNIPAEGRFDVICYFGGNIVKLALLVGQKVQKGQVCLHWTTHSLSRFSKDYLDASSQLS